MNKFKLSTSKNKFLANLLQKTNTFFKKVLPDDKTKYNIFLILIILFFILLFFVLIKGFMKEGLENEEGVDDEEDDEAVVEDDEDDKEAVVEEYTEGNDEDEVSDDKKNKKKVVEKMEEEVCKDKIKKGDKKHNEGLLEEATELIEAFDSQPHLLSQSDSQSDSQVVPYSADLYAQF